MRFLPALALLSAALVLVPVASEEVADDDIASLMTGRRSSLSTGSGMNFGTASAFSQGMVIPSFSISTLGGGPLEESELALGEEHGDTSEFRRRRRRRSGRRRSIMTSEFQEIAEKRRERQDARNDPSKLQARGNSILGLGKTLWDNMYSSRQIMKGPGHKCIDSIKTVLMECKKHVDDAATNSPKMEGELGEDASEDNKLRCTKEVYDDMQGRFQAIRKKRCEAAIRKGYAPECCLKPLNITPTEYDSPVPSLSLGDSNTPEAEEELTEASAQLQEALSDLLDRATTVNQALLTSVGNGTVQNGAENSTADELEKDAEFNSERKKRMERDAEIKESMDPQCDAALCWLDTDQELARYSNVRFTVPYPKRTNEEEEQKFYMVETNMQAIREKAMLCFKTKKIDQPLMCTIQRKTGNFSFSNTRAVDLSAVMNSSAPSAPSAGSRGGNDEKVELQDLGEADGGVVPAKDPYSRRRLYTSTSRRRRRAQFQSAAEAAAFRRRRYIYSRRRFSRAGKEASVDVEVTGKPPTTPEWENAMKAKAALLLSTMNAWIRL